MPKPANNTIAIPHTLGAPDGADLIGDDLDGAAALAADDLDDDLIGDDLDDDGYSPASDIAELRGQIGTLTTMLANGGNKQAAAADAGMPGLDLNGLPDPVTKKDEFNRELSSRITAWAGQQSANLNSQAQQMNASQRAAELESRFATQYPDLSKKKVLMGAAFTAIAEELKQRGRDVKTLLTTEPDKLLKAVAKRMRTELGITDDSSAEGRQAQRKAGRTAGVGAGSRGAAPGKEKKDDKPMGFIAAIKKQQMDMGLY